MVSKKRSRYVMIDKNAMILKLEENLHTTGPNIGKPYFSLMILIYLKIPQSSLKICLFECEKKNRKQLK